jgi:hypothetical protein
MTVRKLAAELAANESSSSKADWFSLGEMTSHNCNVTAAAAAAAAATLTRDLEDDSRRRRQEVTGGSYQNWNFSSTSEIQQMANPSTLRKPDEKPRTNYYGIPPIEETAVDKHLHYHRSLHTSSGYAFQTGHQTPSIVNGTSRESSLSHETKLQPRERSCDEATEENTLGRAYETTYATRGEDGGGGGSTMGEGGGGEYNISRYSSSPLTPTATARNCPPPPPPHCETLSSLAFPSSSPSSGVASAAAAAAFAAAHHLQQHAHPHPPPPTTAYDSVMQNCFASMQQQQQQQEEQQHIASNGAANSYYPWMKTYPGGKF